MLRILMEHLVIKNSLDFKLKICFIYSNVIFNILELRAKMNFSKLQNAQPYIELKVNQG